MQFGMGCKLLILDGLARANERSLLTNLRPIEESR